MVQGAPLLGGEICACLMAQKLFIPSDFCLPVLLTGIKNSQGVVWPRRSVFVMITKYHNILVS